MRKKESPLNKQPISSTADMRADLRKLSSVWSNESLLNTRMLLYACERLDEIAELLRRTRRPRKEPSAYNKFFAKRMKEGFSPSEIGAEWKGRVQ